ncbi:UDP-N-acetylmuramoyl-L-alanine--D-glutamate ligase [Patescibacteria group bacterium]
MLDVKNKKITVMGLGLLGRGIGDVKFLAKKGADLTVTDLKTKKLLTEALKQIKGLKLKLVLGKHRKQDFANKDYILKAAGVPLNSAYIKFAQKNKIPIKMDDSWFAELSSSKIVGITGTRGKTTTSHLINKLLKQSKYKVFLAGNIMGQATLPLIDKVKKDDLVVLELSSWQLQGWAEAKLSPHIAVITNIYRDHLNYYGSMGRYVADKQAIYKYQTNSDYLILNKNNSYSKKFAKEAKSKIIWYSNKDVPKTWQLKISGEHNMDNIAAAIKVAQILKIPKTKIRKAVESFKGVEGRQYLVRDYKNIKYINDTTGTTPEAAIAAINTYYSDSQGGIVLLAGGSDKKLEYKNFAKVIKQKVKAVILFEGAATHKLSQELKKINYNKTIVFVDSMPEAFKQAKYILTKGDIFILSPAAASFGLFINEFDRGDQFNKQVKKIK